MSQKITAIGEKTNPGFWFSVKSQYFLVPNLVKQQQISQNFPRIKKNCQEKFDLGAF